MTAVRGGEPEMVCIDSHGKKQGMGVLDGGHMFDVAFHVCRRSAPIIANSLITSLGISRQTVCGISFAKSKKSHEIASLPPVLCAHVIQSVYWPQTSTLVLQSLKL